MGGDEEILVSVATKDFPSGIEPPSLRIASNDHIDFVANRVSQPIALCLLDTAGPNAGLQVCLIELTCIYLLADMIGPVILPLPNKLLYQWKATWCLSHGRSS